MGERAEVLAARQKLKERFGGGVSIWSGLGRMGCAMFVRTVMLTFVCVVSSRR